VDLQAHLIQRLLDMHDVLSSYLDEAAEMTPESAYSADRAYCTVKLSGPNVVERPPESMATTVTA
jgi:hypothetical protein